MKILITEEQFKNIILEYEDEHDLFEKMNELTYDVFMSIKNKEKIKYNRIDPLQYKQALNEFMKYGEFFRTPDKLIQKFKNICIYNTLLLDVTTQIHGHTSGFPFDEFYDIFEIPEEERDYDFSTAYEYLEEQDIDEYFPTFSNGQPLFSDYGLKPLGILVNKLVGADDNIEIITLVNKILDISHQRSDLSELFIKGGQESLDNISNN